MRIYSCYDQNTNLLIIIAYVSGGTRDQMFRLLQGELGMLLALRGTETSPCVVQDWHSFSGLVSVNPHCLVAGTSFVCSSLTFF